MPLTTILMYRSVLPIAFAIGVFSMMPPLVSAAAAPSAGAAPSGDAATTRQAASDGGLLAGQDPIVDTKTSVLDVTTLGDLGGLVDVLKDARVVFVGETHDRYEDHLNQLAIIRGLHERDRDIAIGMEYFQQPFQPALDAFVAGKLSEADLLRRTEYFDRWRFDYRLYRPILRYAREHGIPLIALNVPSEIVDKVGDGGFKALNEAETATIPAEIDRSDETYRNHIEAVFRMHPNAEDADFEHFLDVQLLWDEGMAERAAEYLEAHPRRTLVVLTGAGHVEYGRGIPQRVTRRVAVPAVTVISGQDRPLDPALADYILYPRAIGLPATGLLGVMLDVESEGDGVGVRDFSDNSGAKAAGIKAGDRIVRVGDQAIHGYADVRIALMDSRPGQKLPVEVIRRGAFLGSPQRLLLQVELH